MNRGDQGEFRFDGPDYHPIWDQKRLTGQILRIFNAILDGCPRTLGEIQGVTGDPQASISAQLRHLRKERFGSYIIGKRRRGEPHHGLFEYWLVLDLFGIPIRKKI